ncbi:dynamin family protein [Bacillus sp. M6-12]|uniref:dynamin family protein n=1 Tax=Bacillus sp. M6-12 TaxID=2054166 RepID=UPI0015E09E93|nr:dynamin family protein [Bacillus sp. M6-12]
MMQISAVQHGQLSRLGELYRKFTISGDISNAEKMKQLMKKLHKEEFIFAFCGHFSAGKSSMINFLMGEQVLPSSPIPTSANTVKLQKGKDYAKVYFNNQQPVLFPAPYDFAAVKEYCKNGDQVASITVSSSSFPLPEQIAVMDTPGIDSTDDAHRVSTESTLHLADIIFYVMDYNHVQSEVNFLFARDMAEAKKPLYLIVNQIDKHDDSELSFSSFKHSVQEAFENWGVTPNGIFYTSLRDLDNENNDIALVKELIANSTRDNGLSITLAAERLILNHAVWQKAQGEEAEQESLELLGQLEEGELEQIRSKLASLKSEKNELSSKTEELEAGFAQELEKVLKNAYIMPAQTREIAKDFLEANQADFKVGLLFSRKKTEAEREERLLKLQNDLSEKVTSQLVWHIKELAAKTLRSSGIISPELEAASQGIELEVNEQLIRKPLKAQAGITGEYVLNYTNDLADTVKKQARNAAAEFAKRVFTAAQTDTKSRLLTIEEELESLQKYEDAFQNTENIVHLADKEKKQLLSILNGTQPPESDEEAALLISQWEKDDRDAAIMESGEIKKIPSADPAEKTAEILPEITAKEQDSEAPALTGKERLSVTAENLTKASHLVSPLQGFQSLYKELKDKAERLNGKTFTVALFGAFSAGKSSFANALMGETVLPVSPNPTTAAINKIKAPKGDLVHGTASVRLKSEHMILEDVVLALSAFQLKADNLDQALEASRSLTEGEVPNDKGKTQLAFLKAFSAGLPVHRTNLGAELLVGLDEFKMYASNEAYSCFVDEIELYYECELTRQGMVLVDTPGADSINARHTGAAFEYIKNSDAILFVTYYNHPFSRADREFLIQLGRVKDSFAMDKMFFLINAVDLAGSAEELNEVTVYVREQLTSFGVRFPKLFPVTSKGAIAEKKGEAFSHHFLPDSGLGYFEQQFLSFIENELTELAIQSARGTLSRTEELLRQVVDSSKQDEMTKRKILMQLGNELERMLEAIGGLSSETDKQRLEKEVNELAYYCIQRVFLRFSDFFKESFNPAVLKDDGRDLKAALQSALRELLDFLGFDFAQEMRATALRAEVYVKKLIGEKDAELLNRLKNIREDITLSDYEPGKMKPLEFRSAFNEMDEHNFKRELSFFKNPKSFFEKNEKQKMSDSLYETLMPAAKAYVETESRNIFDTAANTLAAEMEMLREKHTREIKDRYLGLRSALEENADIPLYEQALKEISERNRILGL